MRALTGRPCWRASQAAAGLAPLDPLLPIGEFPTVNDVRTEVQLLNPRFRSIPYIGREEDLDRLFTWLNEPGAVSFQAVAGRGGSGKTRLAYRFLDGTEERAPYRWHAGLLEPNRFPEALASERFRCWRSRRPMLIAIDYAASCTEMLARNAIAELYSSTMTARESDAPLRVLLLERHADKDQGWYKTLLTAAGDRVEEFFPHEPIQLANLDVNARTSLLDAGLHAACVFDRRMHATSRPRVTLPAGASFAKRLETKKLEDPLVLLMAALVGHVRQDLDSLNLDRVELAATIGLHERRRIESLVRPGRLPFLPLHLTAYVTLTGRLTGPELEAVCREEMEAFGEKEWQPYELPDL